MDHHGFTIAKQPDGRQLPRLPRAGVPAVPAQPARRPVVGGGLRREGASPAGAGRVLASSSTPAACNRPANPLVALEGAGGGRQRLRQVPRRRQAQRGRHDRHLHRLPHPAHRLRRARPPADDLRPVPHGAGPLADRDLPRVEARRPVPRPAAPAQPGRRAEEADHARHVRADLRHLPHERPERHEGDARPVASGSRTTCSPRSRDKRPQLRPGPGGHEGHLPQVPHAAASSTASTRRPRRSSPSTNEKVKAAKDDRRGAAQGRRARPPSRSRQPIDFVYFDLWHYYGRTAKHGAFMGGADFVQWHGNYPILQAHRRDQGAWPTELRRDHGKPSRWYLRPPALAGSVRPGQPGASWPGHLPGPLDQPVPPRGGVHPALLLAGRAAGAARWRLVAASAGARRRSGATLGHLVGWVRGGRRPGRAWSCTWRAASSTSGRSRAWSTPPRSPPRWPTPASACCSS